MNGPPAGGWRGGFPFSFGSSHRFLGVCHSVITASVRILLAYPVVSFPVPGFPLLHLRNTSVCDSVSPPVPDGDSGVRA
jgi:hypothetical protein